MGIVKPNRERQTRWVEEDVLVGVTITLTLDEARWLKQLVGSLAGGFEGSVGVFITDRQKLDGIRDAFSDRLYSALSKAGVPAGAPERVDNGKNSFIAGDSITIPLSWAKS